MNATSTSSTGPARDLSAYATSFVLMCDKDGSVVQAPVAPDLVGENLVDLVHPDDRDRLAAALADGSQAQVRFVTNSHWWANQSVTVIDAAAHVVRIDNVSVTEAAQRLLIDEQRILEMILGDAPLDDVVDAIGDMLEAQGSGRVALADLIATRSDGGDVSGMEIASTLANLAMQRSAITQELRRREHFDELTGLANRAGFCEALSQHAYETLTGGQVCSALAVVDLDRFQSVNSHHGHRGGDALLVEVANLLTEEFGKAELIARLSCDEFAFLIRKLPADPGRAAAEATRVSQRVVDKLSTPISLRTGLAHISASLGLSFASAEDVYLNPEDWLADALAAMDEAKRRGGNRVVVADQSIRARATHRRRMEARLIDEIEQDRLEVWYQPMVNVASGRVVGAEALLRWMEPDGSVLLPMQFLPIAEEAGLMAPITKTTVRAVCQTAARLAKLDEGSRPPYVGVNLSISQLLSDGLVALVGAELERAGTDPSRVIIEITEHVGADDEEAISDRLHGLKRLGVQLSLDDFGTGWASLRLLRSMPFDMVKIDREFVSAGVESDMDREVLANIVSLAKTLGKWTIAEGVELDAHAELLRELGVGLAQGWLYGHALPADDFIETWLAGSAAAES